MVSSALTRLTARFLLWPEEAFILKDKCVTAKKIAASVSAQDALNYAAMRGETNVVVTLCPQGDPGEALVIAAASGRAKVIRALYPKKQSRHEAVERIVPHAVTLALLGNHTSATIELLRLGARISSKLLEAARDFGHHQLYAAVRIFCACNKLVPDETDVIDMQPRDIHKPMYWKLSDAYRRGAAAEQRHLIQLGANNRMLVPVAVVRSGNVTEIRRALLQGWAVTTAQQQVLLVNLHHNPAATLQLFLPFIGPDRPVILTQVLHSHVGRNRSREVIKALIDSGAVITEQAINIAKTPELKKYLREFPRT
ncbi:MAG: hypothetical protein KGL39_01360 [Patescibacteria group bacterium]|nr:hypothetical protein [Patescibacteria group bacterium]